MNYYGPCPSGLDSECPTDPWEGDPVVNTCKMLEFDGDGKTYHVCRPWGTVYPPDEGGGCLCPPLNLEGGTSVPSCLPSDPPECKIICGRFSTCPTGMKCVLSKCMWPLDAGGTGTGTGTGG